MAETSIRRLPINLDELAYALHESDPFGTTRHYLDLDTGEIVMIADEIRAEAEQIGDVIPADAEDYGAAFDEILANSDRPDWMKDSIRLVEAVEAGYGTRFITVPPVGSHEAYEDMADFITTVTNRHTREHLAAAIAGRRPFRRFKDALDNYPQERERWFAFSAERQRQRAVDWLESIGVTPVEVKS
jgi:hypothetical protein